MSSPPLRRPSTLSAAKFSAAQRPIGSTPDPRASARPAQTPMTGAVRQPTSSARASAAPPRTSEDGRKERRPQSRGSGAGSLTKGAATLKQDSQIVTSLVVTFVLLLFAVASVRISGNAKVDRSMDAVKGTLNQVHARQTNFRLINQRFASWRELESSGLRLPGKQSVVASNATLSHWFVSVRDGATGVVCEKTGELFDEGPDDRKPICREPTN